MTEPKQVIGIKEKEIIYLLFGEKNIYNKTFDSTLNANFQVRESKPVLPVFVYCFISSS